MNNNRNKLNIIFSSFLVIGFIICAYFFSSLASQVSGPTGMLIYALITIAFGLLLFYATRVGEGKQVRRFSLAVLLMIDLPSLFIILSGLIDGFPLHDMIMPKGMTAPSIVLLLACVALGYGVPYTFFSGYEIDSYDDDDDDDDDDDEEFVYIEGGIAQELAETERDERETKSTYDSGKYDKYL